MKTRVTDWPVYIFHGPRERSDNGQGRSGSMPPDLRLALSVEAEERDVSVSDTIRGILCEHYRLDCPPVSFGYDRERDKGSLHMSLRLQPSLWKALKRDARRSKRSLPEIIVSILSTHYSAVT